jgi:hypothetical protein
MAKSPDHMAGINALPSTQAYNAAVAAARAGGPRTVEQARAVSKNLEALRMQAMRYRNEQFPLEGSPFGRQGSLAKSINQQLQKAANQAVADKAPKHSTLVSQVPSTCLASLTWKDGIATAEFYRGGQVVYDFPMSKDQWIDWVSAQEGIGRYGNAEVFD